MPVVAQPGEVVFFSSFSAIWAHSSTDAAFMRLLENEGYMIRSLSCDGILPGICNVRASRSRSRPSVEKNSRLDCDDCQYSSKLMTSRVNGSHGVQQWLSQFLLPQDYLDAERLRHSWRLERPDLDALVDGFPLLRWAAYEVLLTFKASPEEVLYKHFEALVDASIGAFLVLRSSKSYFATNSSTRVAVVRSPQYGANRAFAELAVSLGLRVLYLDGSTNVSESYTHVFLKDLELLGWSNPANREISISADFQVSSSRVRVNSHLRALEAGKSHKVYSAPKAKRAIYPIQELFGLKAGRPMLLAALSSTDEAVAAAFSRLRGADAYPGRVFPSQLAWILWLVQWAKARPELDLVIRLHPREFPNKRESQMSSMAKAWEAELGSLPPNVYLNHPNQNLSIYDIFPQCTALTTGWSSVGVEALAFGVPCVTYDKTLPGFLPSLGVTGSSIREYSMNLDLAMEIDSFERELMQQKALEWLDLSMNKSTFELGGRFLASKREFMPRLLRRVLEGIERGLYVIYKPLDLIWSRCFGPKSLDRAAVMVIGGLSPSILDARLSGGVELLNQSNKGFLQDD